MVTRHKHGNDGLANSAGLTLVELMVVIAMTALLSAIMLPALSTAKEKTRRTVCKSNIRQLLWVMDMYVDQNDNQLLPSSADNKGYYHSIVMSDATFTNLVGLADGNSNIFYCPNIAFGANPSVQQHNPQFGFVIGYSYLAGSVAASTKGPDVSVQQVKFPSTATNELLADANYWTTSSSASSDIGYFPASMKVAPHTAMGSALDQYSSSFTVGLPGNGSASVGAMGGNIGFSDWSVQWRTLPQLQTNGASSPNNGSLGLW